MKLISCSYSGLECCNFYLVRLIMYDQTGCLRSKQEKMMMFLNKLSI